MGIPKEYEDGCKIPKGGCMTEWLIKANKVSECPDCSGSGYVPHKDKTMTKNVNIAIEIGCKGCKGKGKLIEKVDLSLESLKELLK